MQRRIALGRCVVGGPLRVALPPEGDNACANQRSSRDGRAGEGGCHAARVLVRAPGDEIGDEERQRNLEGDEQPECGEQDRGRLPDGELARVGARWVSRHGRSASSACAKVPGRLLRLVAGVIRVPQFGIGLAGGWERPVEHQDAPETPVIDALGNVDPLHDSWPCRSTIFHA